MRGEAARIAEGIGESAGGDQRRRYIINLEAIGSRGAGGDDQSFQCPQNQERNHDHWLAGPRRQGRQHASSILGWTAHQSIDRREGTVRKNGRANKFLNRRRRQPPSSSRAKASGSRSALVARMPRRKGGSWSHGLSRIATGNPVVGRGSERLRSSPLPVVRPLRRG